MAYLNPESKAAATRAQNSYLEMYKDKTIQDDTQDKGEIKEKKVFMRLSKNAARRIGRARRIIFDLYLVPMIDDDNIRALSTSEVKPMQKVKRG